MSTSTPHTSAPQQDAPGVVVRPPRLYLAALVLGLLLEFFMPASLIDFTWLEPHQRIIGIAFSVCGILLMSLCMVRFREAGTNVPQICRRKQSLNTALTRTRAIPSMWR